MSGFAAAGKGSDESLGVQGRANTGSFTSARAKVNFIQGANVGIIVTEDGPSEEIRVTISATAPSAGLFGGVSNGFTSGAASGTYVVANQSSVKWGCCFAVGAVGGALSYVGFGFTKGTGSSQAQVTIGSAGTFSTANGAVWTDPGGGGTGGVSAFSGSTFNIFYTNGGGKSVAAIASAVGWT